MYILQSIITVYLTAFFFFLIKIPCTDAQNLNITDVPGSLDESEFI